MGPLTRLALAALSLSSVLLPATANAFGMNMSPPPNRYQAPTFDPNQFRPLPQNNTRGIPPSAMPQQGYYGQPQQPYYSQYPQQAQFNPRLELHINNSQPYERENLILKIRVISGNNLASFDPVFPQTDAVTFQKLRDATARSQVIRGRRQIVNELAYMVTPLKPGRIELPIKANVSTPSNGFAGRSATVESSRPLILEIKPALADVSPWLPVEQLAITSNISGTMDVEPGKPITLILKLVATGAIGSQLPSLEHMLQSPDFRVYRGKTGTEGGPSENGRHIMGTRTEHYTLVPQYGGKLRLPSARLTWFNVKTGTVEHSSLPMKALDSTGKPAGLERFFGDENSGSLFPAGYASMFWLPLMGIFLLMTGYWLGVWYKGRSDKGAPSPLAPLGAAAGKTLSSLGSGTGRVVGKTLGRLSPVRYWNRAMVRLAAVLPTSVRFWFWVRCANDEKDPALWCKTLQFMSCRELSLSPYSPLPEMAEKVIAFQPKADPVRIRELFKTLDGAIYGKETMDFEQWKQDFRSEVKPGLSDLRAANVPHKEKSERKLPDLNPKAA